MLNKEFNPQKLQLLDVVALMEPISSAGLRLGQVGTIVETLADDMYEVEFCDRQGRTLALLPVHREYLLALQYEMEFA